MWHNNDHLYTAFRCSGKCCNHLTVQDQIRRHDMHILLGMIQNMEIHFFAYIFIIIWMISIRNHITMWWIWHYMLRCQIVLAVRRFQLIDRPHFQKQHREALYCITLQHNRRILPVTKTCNFIGILICQVDSAGKRNLAINYTYLTVVSAILHRRQKWYNWIRYPALNAHFADLFIIIIRKIRDCAHTVIHKPYFYAFIRFALQNI